VVFEKEYIMRCSSVEWIARNGCALRWCHRDVGRWSEKTVGFPEWTAQFSVWKTTGKDSSEAWAIACQNCAVYSVFQSGMSSHSKIAQFKWECIALFRRILHEINYRLKVQSNFTRISNTAKFYSINSLTSFAAFKLMRIIQQSSWSIYFNFDEKVR
jgi:hypothetical protein